MKVIVREVYGSPDVLRLGEVPVRRGMGRGEIFGTQGSERRLAMTGTLFESRAIAYAAPAGVPDSF